MIRYFHHYIPAYAELTLSFMDQLKAKKPDKINWMKKLDLAFTRLNQVIMDNTTLVAPDFGRKFILYTDASAESIAGALLQKDKDSDQL